MGSIRICVDDAASEELLRLAREYPAFYKRALKSLGWMAQIEIKRGIHSAMPGGEAYAPPVAPGTRRKFDAAFKKQQKRRYPLLGQLYRAVGYDKRNVSQGEVIVGWLSKSAVDLGSKVEKGAVYPITKAMRGKLFAGGIYTRKAAIVVEERPTFGPMRKVIKEKAVNYLLEKMKKFINNPNLRSNPRKKRRYRVYE